MIRRMTFVCSVAMAAAVVIWFFGVGASVLSAQEPDANRVIMTGNARTGLERELAILAGNYTDILEPSHYEPGGDSDDGVIIPEEPNLPLHRGGYGYFSYRLDAPCGTVVNEYLGNVMGIGYHVKRQEYIIR